jgi:hypothetical protein
MLNPYRRTVCLEGRLGACLVTGTEKIRSGYGNGDCLLLDFRHRLFAVADASERFPQASHLLVEQLLEAVLESGPPETEPEFNALLERVWSRQPFTHKSTLSCVRLIASSGGPAAMIANNGDSSVRVIDPGTHRVFYRTSADMNFAGRSQHPNPVVTRPLEGTSSLLLLATDGLSDVREKSSTGMTAPPHRLGGWISTRVRRACGKREIDDIGAMALTAGAMEDCAREILIMGGTQPAVETAFSRVDGQATALDRWRPIEAWKAYPELLATAGIRII